MNKKFVATVALVLLVVVGLTAAPTFSGRFRQGFSFNFNQSGNTVTEWKDKEAKLVFKVADENGLWAISFGTLNGTSLDSNDKYEANATVSFSKALALAGLDLGDFGISFSLGNMSAVTALSAYNDVTGNGYYKLKNNGVASGYVDLNYGSWVQVRASIDPTDTGRSGSVSTVVAPIDGVKVGFAYGYNMVSGIGSSVKDKHGINGSATVDIAALCDLDFKLGLSFYDTYLLESSKNYLAANINGGYGPVWAYSEFFMFDGTMGLNNYVEFTGVENLGTDVYFNIANFTDVANTITVGGDVSYKIAGVTYAVNMEYGTAAKTFSLTPYIVISF